MTKIEEIVHSKLDGVAPDSIIDGIAKAIEKLVLAHATELGKDIALESMCPSCLNHNSTFNVCAGCGTKLRS